MGNTEQNIGYEVPFQDIQQKSGIERDMRTFMPRVRKMGGIGMYSMTNGSSDYVTVNVEILDRAMERVVDSRMKAYVGMIKNRYSQRN